MTRSQRAPRPTLDLSAVRAHLHDACSLRSPALLWIVVADVPVLLAEIDRLHSLTRLSRGQYADLLAAARATLSADRDGEAEPLCYLRDELDANSSLPGRHTRACLFPRCGEADR
jgi:hypothetical protein